MGESTLLRSLAALLIANSHVEHFYPIRQLAPDGLLGDSLFFFLSGYGLVRSARRADRGFVEWYGRRVARIYPTVLLVTLFCDFLPNARWATWTPADYARHLAWGHPYGFVSQIMTFYVIFYGIMRWKRPKVYPVLFFLLFIPDALPPLLGRSDALFHAFHWLFYFQVMLLGGLLGRQSDSIAPGGIRELGMLALAAAVYVAGRLAVAGGRGGGWFFLPHLLIFPMVYLLFRLARSPRLARGLERLPRVSWAVGLLGGATLEVYLLHYQVLRTPWIAGLVFPLNVAVFLVVSVALACLLSEAIGRARRALAAPRLPRDHAPPTFDAGSVTQ